VCYVVGMDHVQKNIDRGHNRFAQYVIPLLAQHGWPSNWQCMQGTIPDTKYGIDYMVGKTPVAARIWDGKPKQHFALRWYNTRHPGIRMELTKMLELWANNQTMPKYTIEAHTHNNRTYVAVCQTHVLAQIVADNMPNLPQFIVNNHTGDFTVFVRVAFDLFPPDAVRKFIG
jgi:hypothetical protein